VSGMVSAALARKIAERLKRYAPLLILIVGTALRLSVAPYSSGSDIPQFAGFAGTFLRHGLCFYEYAGSSSFRTEGWPYSWPYPYGPVWVVLTSILLLIVGDGNLVKCFWRGGTYYVYVSIKWVTAVKTVLIAADVVLAYLLYRYVRRKYGRSWGTLSLILYYLNPMTIYVTSIYGMFDQLALLFLVAAMLSFLSGKYVKVGLLTSLALLTKQTLLAPAVALIACTRGKRALTVLTALAASALALLPFLAACPHTVERIMSILLSTSRPGYTEPLVYSFNGFSSLATYLHSRQGMSLSWVMSYWYLPFIALFLPLIYRAARSSLSVDSAVMLSYAVFVATYWRVNAQYMLPLVGLTALALPRASRVGRALLLLLNGMVALWPVSFPISWWFHVHIEHPNTMIWRVLDTFNLMIFDELYYVVYSLVLTVLLYVTAIYFLVVKRSGVV